MNRVMRIALLLSLLLILGIVPSLRAWWFTDGVPVTIAPGVQKRCRLTTDGTGGAIIVWEDSTGGVDPDIVTDVYAQRIDLLGTAQWSYGGIGVCTEIEHQERCQIISDLMGGAFIVWEDYRDANADIYAQRIYGSGNFHWNQASEPVCTDNSKQTDPQLAMDWTGGVYVVWMDYRNGADIYAQRLDGGGQPLWTIDGDSICTAAGIQEGPKIVSEGPDGAIMTWFDGRSGNNDIYAQKIDLSGAVLWTVDGVPVCTAANDQNWPEIISDGAGGAIISWHDGRAGLLDIYAQRIDASGDTLWTVDGVPLCTAVGDQAQTQIVSDGAGGAIVTWIDGRSGLVAGLFVQHIDSSGTIQWADDGVPLCTSTLYFSPERLIYGLASDGAGGAIATWSDTRGGRRIYAQRIDDSETIQWPTDGVLLSNASSNQELPGIIPDGTGGAIIAWQDDRSGEFDIYAQQVDAQGRIGYLLPEIHSVSDVHGDQGGMVNLTWDAPRTDFITGDITEYTIWRALETPAALGMLAEGATIVSNPTAALETASMGKGDPILRQASLNGTMLYWELMFTQAAYRLEGYAKAVETLFDSTAVNDDYHYFQVIAHTDDPSIFYVSEPDSGYSVDDLAPCSPAGVTGTQSFSPEGLWLTWNQNAEADFDLYNVYRDIGPSFDPGPGNLLLATCETNTFDGEWSWNAGYCYKVTAVDIHGNESEYASVCAEQVTGDDPVQLPDATFLAQNFPNPFNPSTTIAFGLKKSGHVSLRIYDASGRLVTELVDETRPSGSYTVEWNGRENKESDTASGVYFYSLIAGEFKETKKMILLR